MDGVRVFAERFMTGQYGKLYIVSGRHARGKTFHIYVLPEGEEAIPNGESNPPLNESAVEVYGVVSGQCGWTESYGWLHTRAWQEDFLEMNNQELQEEEIFLKRILGLKNMRLRKHDNVNYYHDTREPLNSPTSLQSTCGNRKA